MDVEISIEAAVVEGQAPIRRAAYLARDDRRDLLVSAQGNADTDRWVLAWEPPRGIRWIDIVHEAIAAHEDLLGAESHIEGWALYGDQFEDVGPHGRSSTAELLRDFRTFLNQRGEPPSILVVNSVAFQIEVIFEPNHFRPALITVLTSSQDAGKFSSFFKSFHPVDWMRENAELASTLLDGICSNNQNGEDSWEQKLRFSVDTLS